MKLEAVQPRANLTLIAPASYAADERVQLGTATLEALGYKVKLGEHARARGPLFFSGTPADRLADLHAAFADDAVDAVMCLRGGYGSNYLLGGLDLELIAAHPKPLFGYSDLTGVQLHLLDKIDLPAFHGPMAAADFYLEQGVDQKSFAAALAGQSYSVSNAEGLRPMRQGNARGVLYGGCLSILVAMLGTPYEPHTEGKLLFLEDLNAKPYQVDRMLWQMRKAGKFEGVTGILFGEMLDCASPGADPTLIEQAILSALDGFEGPIGFGLRSGHVSHHNVTLTFGVEAELTVANEARLTLREAMERA
ncbi:S66 peptidase family protein [Telmatobacter bradus]|uniref:S66 peptidase family protein n=1 Tax=Telmatobacter bradus TaxID=474953 RepID=UPI003B439CD9